MEKERSMNKKGSNSTRLSTRLVSKILYAKSSKLNPYIKNSSDVIDNPTHLSTLVMVQIPKLIISKYGSKNILTSIIETKYIHKFNYVHSFVDAVLQSLIPR